ncbi:MAG: hypothetical protein FJ137_18880 [Deltaproteobacteria bacterium]|nr:hypothetical protein [Deltaproteobacteria bacterium]
MQKFKFGSALVLVAALGLGGCATFERKSDQVPAGYVRLAELKRNEYRVGERVEGKATVKAERNMLQKLLPFLFGRETISGDQKVTPGLLTITEDTTAGIRGASASAVSSGQIADLVLGVLSQAGISLGSAGSSAIAQATAAAYYRALQKAPGADFLLEPRVEVSTKGSSSLFFLTTDEETATVSVSGKPITIYTDGSSAPAAPAGG